MLVILSDNCHNRGNAHVSTSLRTLLISLLVLDSYTTQHNTTQHMISSSCLHAPQILRPFIVHAHILYTGRVAWVIIDNIFSKKMKLICFALLAVIINMYYVYSQILDIYRAQKLVVKLQAQLLQTTKKTEVTILKKKLLSRM